jgi:hypothetical protein
MNYRKYLILLILPIIGCTQTAIPTKKIQSDNLITHLELSCKVFKGAMLENRTFAMDYQDVVLMDLFTVAMQDTDKNDKNRIRKIRSLYEYHISNINGGDSIEGWADIGKELSRLENAL